MGPAPQPHVRNPARSQAGACHADSAPTTQGGLRGLIDRAAHPSSRCPRVTLLLGAALIVSVVDLLLTLKFVTSVGMIEANPIARWVMRSGDTSMLILFKVALTLFSLGIIFALRRLRAAEIGAWCCFGVMLALSFQWSTFLHKVQTEHTPDWNYLQQSNHPAFVMMPTE